MALNGKNENPPNSPFGETKKSTLREGAAKQAESGKSMD